MADSFWDSLLSSIKNNPGLTGAAIGGIGTLLDPAKDQTKTTQQAVTLPDYAAPYVGRMLNQAESLSQEAYMPYTGARLADFNADQNQAFQNYRSMTVPTAGTDAANIATSAAQRALNSSYTPTTYNYTPITASGVSANNIDYDKVNYSGDWNDAAAQQYMSPYQQGVTDIAKREAERVATTQMQNLRSEAAKRGAFGGTRQAVLEAEQDRNSSQLLNDIQTKGLQDAYTSGMGQFNTDRALKTNIGFGNQQAGIQVGTANQQAQLAAAKASADAQARAAEFNAQQQMAQQRDREASRQFAANYGLSSLGTALQGAGTAAGIGAQNFQQANTINQNLLGIGNTQQALEQKGMDTAYQDFINQRDDPYKKLQYMQSFLSGLPMTQTATANTTPAPTLTQQLIGNTLGGYGIGSLGNTKP